MVTMRGQLSAIIEYLSISLSLSILLSAAVCLTVCVCVYLSLSLSVCLSVSLSLSLSLSLSPLHTSNVFPQSLPIWGKYVQLILLRVPKTFYL